MNDVVVMLIYFVYDLCIDRLLYCHRLAYLCQLLQLDHVEPVSLLLQMQIKIVVHAMHLNIYEQMQIGLYRC